VQFQLVIMYPFFVPLSLLKSYCSAVLSKSGVTIISVRLSVCLSVTVVVEEVLQVQGRVDVYVACHWLCTDWRSHLDGASA